MKIIKTNKDKPYLLFLNSGKKTVEGRLNKGKFKKVNIGDIFEIKGSGERFEIIAQKTYKDFKELLKSEGIENVLPDKKGLKEALAVYYKYYSAEDEEKYGVVAFKLKKLI